VTGCKLTATPKSKRFTTKDTKVAQNARKESLRDFLACSFVVAVVFYVDHPGTHFRAG